MSISASANVLGDIHWPQDGDRVMMTRCEYIDMPSDTAVWDFSHIVETAGRHRIRWAVLGDTLLVKYEQGGQSTYRLIDGTLYWQGYENPVMCVRDSIAPAAALNALFSGSGISCPLYVSGSYCGNHAIDMAGSHEAEVSGYGTLILPNDTIENARCVTSTRDCLVRVSEHRHAPPITGEACLSDRPAGQAGRQADSLIRKVEVVQRWYSPVHRYPLAENVSRGYYRAGELLRQTDITYLCPPGEQEYALGKLCDPETLLKNAIGHGSGPNYSAAGENSALGDLVTVTQGQDNVVITTHGGKTGNDRYSVLLCDVQGRVWHCHKSKNQSEFQHYEIATATLPTGYYLLEVACGNKKYVKRICVRQ